MAADLQGRRMAYLCSKQGDQGPQLVSPGLHGVTNGVLEAHWPKASAVSGLPWGTLVRGDARLAAFAGLGQACRAGCDQGKQKRTAALLLGCKRACRVWPGTGLA